MGSGVFYWFMKIKRLICFKFFYWFFLFLFLCIQNKKSIRKRRLKRLYQPSCVRAKKKALFWSPKKWRSLSLHKKDIGLRLFFGSRPPDGRRVPTNTNCGCSFQRVIVSKGYNPSCAKHTKEKKKKKIIRSQPKGVMPSTRQKQHL